MNATTAIAIDAPSPGQLAADHAPFVVHVARKYRHRLSPEEYDDVTQEGHLALAAAARSFDPKRLPPSMFLAFAGRRISRAISRAVLRAEQARRGSVPLRDQDQASQRRADEDRRLAWLVEAALGGLTPIEAWVVHERYGLGSIRTPRKMSEMAADCGLPCRRVREIERAALAKLRKILLKAGTSPALMLIA